MSKAENSEDPDRVTSEDMKGWLKREIADISKASQLRIAEATAFVEAYGREEITHDQLTARIDEYQGRWGEALPGVGRSQDMTDEQILTKITKTRVQQGELGAEVLRRRKVISPRSPT